VDNRPRESAPVFVAPPPAPPAPAASTDIGPTRLRRRDLVILLAAALQALSITLCLPFLVWLQATKAHQMVERHGLHLSLAGIKRGHTKAYGAIPIHTVDGTYLGTLTLFGNPGGGCGVAWAEFKSEPVAERFVDLHIKSIRISLRRTCASRLTSTADESWGARLTGDAHWRDIWTDALRITPDSDFTAEITIVMADGWGPQCAGPPALLHMRSCEPPFRAARRRGGGARR
jgi:hypothetical protein